MIRRGRTDFFIIATDGRKTGWEHVSMRARDYQGERCPRWEEMCWARDLFWEPEECVVQYHPPRADYINCHPHVLHLWRPLAQALPQPPSWMVGPKIS